MLAYDPKLTAGLTGPYRCGVGSINPTDVPVTVEAYYEKRDAACLGVVEGESSVTRKRTIRICFGRSYDEWTQEKSGAWTGPISQKM